MPSISPSVEDNLQLTRLQRESLASDLIKKTELNHLPKLLNELKSEIQASSRPIEIVNLIKLIQQCLEYVHDLVQSSSTHNKKIASWVKSQDQVFCTCLLALVGHQDKRVSILAFERYLSHLKIASESVNEFQQKLYLQLISALFTLNAGSSSTSSVLSQMMNVIKSHYDLVFFFYKAAGILLKQKPLPDDMNVNTINIVLCSLPIYTKSDIENKDVESWCQGSMKGLKEEKNSALESPAAFKRYFSEAWLAFLTCKPLGSKLYESILERMHEHILPHLAEPCLLMDFLVEAYNSGGLVSLLALNGLFTLITQYNLDYPDFYKKLYILFDSGLLHSKYRGRFFRLVELFLLSTHIPSYLVSAFLKRMGRLCVTAPPGAIMLILPLMFNLLKKHPSSIALIHRDDSDMTAIVSDQLNKDPFLFAEKDPSKSHASESCLWEIVALQNHYLPTVSSLAKIFEGSLAKATYNLDSFFDQDYQMILDTEISRNKSKLGNKEALPLAASTTTTSELFKDSMWQV